ncbi:MAG: Pr6Pr family membrane protein [Devosia sp.]
MKQAATWIGFVVGAAALILQFALTIPLRLNNSDSLFGAVIFYFTFFTILTNLVLVLIYASELWPRTYLHWFRWPVTRGMMAAAIALVGGFYHFFLAEAWDPQGLAQVADVTLHYITPILYVLWWLLFMRHGLLKFAQIPSMLLPPTIYLIYAMIRGAIVGEYPYTILEANRLGYAAVAINVVLVLVALIVLSAIVVAIDRALARVDMPGR